MIGKEKNWWTDPENAERVKELSWWEHPKNKITYPLPLSCIESDNKYWVIASNKETVDLLGHHVSASQGKTKDDAIYQFFSNMRFMYEYQEECRLRYQRWVPLRVGPWSSIGGNWFAIFGIHISFRIARPKMRQLMKGGWFVPLTNLNISVRSDWRTYRNYKLKKAEQ